MSGTNPSQASSQISDTASTSSSASYPQPPGLFSAITEAGGNANTQALQQRLFGLVNEAGTNLSHVPTGLVQPGQSFTFQHARYAISGSQLGQVLAQPHDSARASIVSAMLNQSTLPAIYRPDFVGGSAPMNSNPSIPFAYPGTMGATNFVPNLPNFTSVIAQRLPKSANPQFFQATSAGMPMPAMYQAFANTGSWPLATNPFLGQTVTQQPMAIPTNSTGVSEATKPAKEKDLKKGHKRTASDDDLLMKKKRKKRDPSLPTPARFAWNFFFRDQYTKIRNSEPSEHSNVQKAFTDIGFDLGKKWKSLTKEEKEPYLRMAAMDKERYEREMQARFSSAVGGSAASATTTAGESSEGEEEEGEDEKVCLVLHEIEVEDKRPEEEKKSDPTEGELVADVLVVDDDEVFLKIIRHKLVVGQKHPPRVVTVTSASDAKRMIVDENKKFGTVLLDKDLGEGKEDGISSLAVLRESGYQGVIVGVTGSTDDKTRSQFTESGANQTFIKGTSNFYEDLLALVKLHSHNVEHMENEEEVQAPSSSAPKVSGVAAEAVAASN